MDVGAMMEAAFKVLRLIGGSLSAESDNVASGIATKTPRNLPHWANQPATASSSQLSTTLMPKQVR
jgi:hypothetical protein